MECLSLYLSVGALCACPGATPSVAASGGDCSLGEGASRRAEGETGAPYALLSIQALPRTSSPR